MGLYYTGKCVTCGGTDVLLREENKKAKCIICYDKEEAKNATDKSGSKNSSDISLDKGDKPPHT